MPVAVFLDRDDTLIANRSMTAHTDHPGDQYDVAMVTLLPGVAEACRALKSRGYLLIVVSNQGAVARGRCTIEQVQACNERMNDLLKAKAGIGFDGMYFCPHHPGGNTPPFDVEHPWRKPSPGMLMQAASDYRIEIPQSWMIGDAERDIEAALAAGIPSERALLVRHAGGGVQGEGARFSDMASAARHVLRE